MADINSSKKLDKVIKVLDALLIMLETRPQCTNFSDVSSFVLPDVRRGLKELRKELES